VAKDLKRKELQEAREILKPVLRAEKKLQKAAKSLVVAKLALAHALVETNVESNPTLSTWTEGVLSGDETTVRKIYETLTTKKKSGNSVEKPAAPIKVAVAETSTKPVAKQKSAIKKVPAKPVRASPANKPALKKV
jgi:hypothetical protein